ncbi:YbaB/EbfC family nucleoid-associated protein [Krasilnikovia sp. M28-CT-15]|uniref:YbaB/EbfC family nucleoid-associated protein n=1 Tax=Krasilnikovia sp. M28-CT-15 TaxID=3373540 RepID=UPI0038764FEC
MYDVDEAEGWLDALVSGADVQAALAVDLSRKVAALTGTARSTDGLIAVSVGSNGQLVDVSLDDRALTTGRELSRRILQVTRDAQHNLADAVTAEVQRTVGEDSATGQAVIDSFARRFPQEPSPDTQTDEGTR